MIGDSCVQQSVVRLSVISGFWELKVRLLSLVMAGYDPGSWDVGEESNAHPVNVLKHVIA